MRLKKGGPKLFELQKKKWKPSSKWTVLCQTRKQFVSAEMSRFKTVHFLHRPIRHLPLEKCKIKSQITTIFRFSFVSAFNVSLYGIHIKSKSNFWPSSNMTEKIVKKIEFVSKWFTFLSLKFSSTDRFKLSCSTKFKLWESS